jgi:enoyl-[acyl-carrier protein] reductase/trans-2-enoyl-CoA reductase (NAD+)
MRPDVQADVARLWEMANPANVESLSDLAAYRQEFFKLFGFGFPQVNYTADVNPDVSIPSLRSTVTA